MPIISIYERDASPSDRENLGYSFSVMEGLHVLRNLKRGILEELIRLQEPSNAANFCKQDFQPLLSVSPKQGEGMNTKTYEVLRIMRTRLRQTLLSKVPAEWIQFGKTCISAEPPLKEGQPVKLQFSDGSDAECDLLVAADGANSKLRNYLLPEEKTRYAGVTMLFGRTRPLKQLPPEIARGINLVIGRGSTTLFMGSVDKNTVTWSLSQKIPQSQAAEMNETFKDPAAAQEFLENEVPRIAQGFTGALPAVLAETPASSLVAIPGMDKPPHKLQHNGIVYIGDAWHPMTPFAGAGANMALMDADDLVEELVNGNHSSAQAAIDSFAEKAPKRSADAIKSSRMNIALAHSEGWRKRLLLGALGAAGVVLRSVQKASSILRSQPTQTPS